MGTPFEFWKKMASRWEKLGPPLRPGVQDHKQIEQVVHKWTAQNGSPKILVLGVTPEMARLDVPDETEILAVDFCQEMIDHLWPGEGALCADWMDLPLQEHSRDLVIGDGPFGALRYPDEFKNLARSVRRVIRPNGLFVFRVFLQPETREEPDEVCEAAMAGEIKSCSAFKFRLVIALQPDTETGGRFGNVWNYWDEYGPDEKELAVRTGWPMEEIQAFKMYKNSDFTLTYPTLQQIRKLLNSEEFEAVESLWPTYELGERCPTLVFTPAED